MTDFGSRDHMDLPYMTGSYANGASASQVAKIRTKENFSNVAISYSNFVPSRDRNWLKAFSAFYLVVSQDYTQNIPIQFDLE